MLRQRLRVSRVNFWAGLACMLRRLSDGSQALAKRADRRMMHVMFPTIMSRLEQSANEDNSNKPWGML